MKKTLLLSLILLLFVFSGKTQNQEVIPDNSDMALSKGFYFGGVASTNGWGAEVKYLFNDKLTIKTGFETLNVTKDFNFDENDIRYDGSFDYKTGGIFVLADNNFIYHLYVSGGMVFNSFNPEVTGHSVSALEFGDITIPAEDVGDFKYSFSPKTKVSPYGGLGWRSFIGKDKRLVLNFETGMYYMGSPQVDIEATGLLAPTADPAQGQKEKLESQLEQYKIYPVIKFNLAIKLF